MRIFGEVCRRSFPPKRQMASADKAEKRSLFRCRALTSINPGEPPALLTSELHRCEAFRMIAPNSKSPPMQRFVGV